MWLPQGLLVFLTNAEVECAVLLRVLGIEPAGVPKRRQTGAAGKPAAASKPAAPPAVSRPGNLKGHLLLTRSMQGAAACK